MMSWRDELDDLSCDRARLGSGFYCNFARNEPLSRSERVQLLRDYNFTT
jgi:hypothetical protein